MALAALTALPLSKRWYVPEQKDSSLGEMTVVRVCALLSFASFVTRMIIGVLSEENYWKYNFSDVNKYILAKTGIMVRLSFLQ